MLDQIESVLGKYKTLEFDPGTVTLKGLLFASESDDDKYAVEVKIDRFPFAFPPVWETGERIPRKKERHCNETDGSLCFTTRPKAEILLATTIFTLVDFVEKIVIPYLQNNSYFELNGSYKFGEYSHYSEISIYETYSELLDMKNPVQLEDTLSKLANGLKIRPNEPCYCGRRQKIKHCHNHHDLYKDIKRLSTGTLREGKEKIAQINLELERFQAKAASAK